ncbi:MAG: DNA mismatch repair protein MutS, partial [Ruminococcus sp.]|nr:DNA mismatch repair protein MutS [Ruminococcus sp.]
EILEELESGRAETVVIEKKETDDQLPLLFAEQNSPVIDKIKAADLNTLTPIEAMNLLYELKGMVQ